MSHVCRQNVQFCHLLLKLKIDWAVGGIRLAHVADRGNLIMTVEFLCMSLDHYENSI